MADEPESGWLEVGEVMQLERISRVECYRRMRPDDSHRLIWREKENGRGRVIYGRSMTYDAHERWKAEKLKDLVNGQQSKVESLQNHPAPSPQDNPTMPAAEAPTTGRNTAAGPALEEQGLGGRDQGSEERQGRLWPQTELDRKIAALDVPDQQRPVILGRFRIIRPLVNHDYKAFGYASKTRFIAEQARLAGVSRNTIWRWYWDYKAHEDLRDLANEAPGPEATGIGSLALDLQIDVDGQAKSMRAFIKERWLAGALKKQICREVIGYLTAKQRGCGPSFLYRFPSETTICRFIDSLDALDHAERQGPDAVKAALGHIDRAYADLRSLDVVECDECQLNALSFDDRHHDKSVRYWLVTLYDEATMYPLVWSLVGAKDGVEKLHGITQEDERALFERLVREYGLPGTLHSDRGRFRGNFWGHEPGKKRDREFELNDGILGALGVGRNRPREHNPRGTRLERFHGFLRDKGRDLGGWIGRNTEERKMARGDANWQEHLEYVAGRRTDTPILSRAELLEHVNTWMEEWRGHSSTGTDMNGLSPRAAFLQRRPAEGFRQPDAVEMEILSSEYYPDRRVLEGGIIELPDGMRYGLTGELERLAGQRRHVSRSSSDHNFIKVLAAQKGQENIVAHLRPRIGHHDPEILARSTELQTKLRKLHSQMTAVQKEQVSIGEISSSEYMMQRLARQHLAADGRQKIRQEVAAPEPAVETLAAPAPSEAEPTLYDIQEISVEEV